MTFEEIIYQLDTNSILHAFGLNSYGFEAILKRKWGNV
jgi:hypothetical protein